MMSSNIKHKIVPMNFLDFIIFAFRLKKANVGKKLQKMLNQVQHDVERPKNPQKL